MAIFFAGNRLTTPKPHDSVHPLPPEVLNGVALKPFNMNRPFFRAAIIAFISLLLGASITALTNLETKISLDSLFRIRGTRPPPADVVIVAMDEASENQLGVGQDLTRWRSFHAKLIQQLQRQGASLIVFDLQFLGADPINDPAIAKAMRTAGNVLVTECVQKFRHGVADFFGRDECSDSNKQPAVFREDKSAVTLAEELVAMRKISPTPIIAESVLDRAPFYLINDAENASVLETWSFFDALAEQPSLPVLSWFYYLQHSGILTQLAHVEPPLSAWLTALRRSCASGLDQSIADHRQIATLLCDGDSRYLNYYGPPHTLRMESYSDVYLGKVTDLQNKVLFIGRANRQFSSGKTDFFQTPFSDSRTGKMAGVEIMATQVANLIEDRFIEMPAPALLICGIFGLSIAALLTRFAGWMGILLSFAVGISYALLAVWSFARFNYWLPTIAPLLIQLPLSWLIALSWSRYDLLRERQSILAFVHRVFPQWLTFLPASPGQWAEKNHLPTRSERDVSGLCLATDIEGYTAIAAHHRPRKIWELLNAYYRVLGHPVTSRGGEITDVTGDAMMAIWIDSPPNQRRAACLAALEMEKAISTFNRSSSAEPLSTRIGLHQGEFTLGRLDAGKSSHYRAIGDTVNITSRIEGVNKYLGTKILASNAVISDLTDIMFRPVGLFRLVGREEPIELVEVVGTTDNIDTVQIKVYRQFAEGLAAFRQGKWMNAARLFQNILTLDAHDGPTQFYLDLALEYSQNPSLIWEGFISLKAK